MNLTAIENRISRIEQSLGDDLEQAMKETHHDVLLAIRFKILVMQAEGCESSDAALSEDWRIDLAAKVGETDARYRATGRDALLQSLPTSYTCGKCGSVVPIEVEKMMRIDAKLPACGCGVNSDGEVKQ